MNFLLRITFAASHMFYFYFHLIQDIFDFFFFFDDPVVQECVI